MNDVKSSLCPLLTKTLGVDDVGFTVWLRVSHCLLSLAEYQRKRELELDEGGGSRRECSAAIIYFCENFTTTLY